MTIRTTHREVTYLAPFPEGPQEKKGILFRAYVGHYQKRFILQPNAGGISYELVQYESGALIRGLPDLFRQEAGFRLWSFRRIPDWKQAAKIFLERLVEKHGEDRVLAVINSAQQLNHK